MLHGSHVFFTVNLYFSSIQYVQYVPGLCSSLMVLCCKVIRCTFLPLFIMTAQFLSSFCTLCRPPRHLSMGFFFCLFLSVILLLLCTIFHLWFCSIVDGFFLFSATDKILQLYIRKLFIKPCFSQFLKLREPFL